MQDNGHLILPVKRRQALELGEGDRVVLQRVDDRIESTTARLSRARIRAQFSDAENVVDDFLAERRAEAEREGAETDAPRRGAGADR